MLHGRRAAIMGVDLRGFGAWNPRTQVIAPHLPKYRIFWVAAQQRFYGRWRFGRLPFHDAHVTESPDRVVLSWGHCHCPFGGLGEGTELRLVRSLDLRGWALLGIAAVCIALPGMVTPLGGAARAGVSLEERKLPMRFSWVECQPNCRGWISAVGIVTTDTPKDFDRFAHVRSEALQRPAHLAGFQELPETRVK